MKLRTSEPFWLGKNGLINSYSSLRNDINPEILVIGGGITGDFLAIPSKSFPNVYPPLNPWPVC